jgi:hypothetical protein
MNASDPRPALRRPLLAVLLAAAPLAAAGAPVPDYFPLDVGSEWTYATDLAQGDWLVQALCREAVGGADPHGHAHEGEPGTKKPERIEHVVLVRTLAVPGGAGGRRTTIAKEWFRRDDDGELLCGRRRIGQEDAVLDPPQLVLPADPAAKKQWDASFQANFTAMQVKSSVEAEETVRVPAGEFKALRVKVVTTTGRGTGRATRWFAAGVGLVKEEVEVDAKGGPLRTRAELKSYRIGPPAEK